MRASFFLTFSRHTYKNKQTKTYKGRGRCNCIISILSRGELYGGGRITGMATHNTGERRTTTRGIWIYNKYHHKTQILIYKILLNFLGVFYMFSSQYRTWWNLIRFYYCPSDRNWEDYFTFLFLCFLRKRGDKREGRERQERDIGKHRWMPRPCQ